MRNPLLSVQLYTVREALQADVAGTLARLAAIGFRQVEPYDFTAFGAELVDGLAIAGLAAPTTHARILDTDASAVFAAAAAAGIGTVIDPSAGRERFATEAAVAETAAAYNAAARLAAAHGVRIGYHNHAYELESVLGGTTALERFAALLDPGVILEVDTYWAAVGGQDPVALLTRLGERVGALHLKDGPFTQDTKDQVALGRGSLPVRAIVDAAPTALRVVELDDSRGDRFEAVADSVAFLLAEGLA